MHPEIPKEVQKRIRRGREGKWLFCLAEYNHRKWPGKLQVVETTTYTNEASARLYFSGHLALGNCVLIKIPERVAVMLRGLEKGIEI